MPDVISELTENKQLPTELLVEILMFLDASSIINATAVNKTWHYIINFQYPDKLLKQPAEQYLHKAANRYQINFSNPKMLLTKPACFTISSLKRLIFKAPKEL